MARHRTTRQIGYVCLVAGFAVTIKFASGGSLTGEPDDFEPLTREQGIEALVREELSEGSAAEESLIVRIIGFTPGVERITLLLAILRRIATAENTGFNSYRWTLKPGERVM